MGEILYNTGTVDVSQSIKKMIKVSDYGRVFIIGDIHGWNHPFQVLIDAINPGADDMIITLGDYVDRGPENPQVLDTLISLWNSGLLIPLRGNHDQAMMEASFSQEQLLSWRDRLLGESTLRTYGIATDTLAEFNEKVPREHIYFLRNCLRNYLELDQFICVHGGVHPRLEMKDQPSWTLQWKTFHKHCFPHISGKVLCCGHSAVGPIPKVDLLGRAVCVDTQMGISPDGWLTASELNTGKYIQVDRSATVRYGELDWPIGIDYMRI